MIKLEYLAHSSFLLTCGDKKIVFDPWFSGAAYFRQWYLWPVHPGKIPLDYDAIIISHGHEDHLHTATLRSLSKKAHIFFPFQWRKGIKPFLQHLGFEQVTEAVTFSTYKVGEVSITYMGYALESVVVVEYRGCVLVNINDALNSNHHNAVNYMLAQIKKRWPKIDYLLSGWSGASYFPNQVKYKTKNDVEIAKIREQYFANNFCLFTRELNPAVSIPFVTGFVLLRKSTQWINHIKFPRRKVAAYFAEHYGSTSTRFLVPYPGDVIEQGEMVKHSPLHELDEEEVYHKAYEYYSKEKAGADVIEYISETEEGELMAGLGTWMQRNSKLYHKEVLQELKFSIRLEDVREQVYINICWKDDRFEIVRAAQPLADRQVLITTAAKKINYALKKVWGGDVITIGYGLEVEMYDELSLEKNLDIVCVRLITRYPIARQEMIKYPFRVARFYLLNPGITSLWLKQKIRLKPYINKYPANERDHWFTYNKCDLCQVCKMPEVNNHAYNSFVQ